jgi:hypothetical protein
MTAMAALAGIIGLLFAFCLMARRAGRTEERLTKEEQVNEAVRKALAARDRLLSDADYAERVRKRFER